MQKAPQNQKNCFFISPIGAVGSDIRRRSDQILRHIIRPAARECSYIATRADEIDSSGMISTQILERILGDELVVADLTDQNPNVFYELAVRHATRKPFIQLIADGQAIPFDVQGIRTIEVDHRDLDSAAAARESIVNAIRAIDEGQPVDTPMTYTLDLQDLRGSGRVEDRGIADILDVVQSIQRQLVRPNFAAERSDLAALTEMVTSWVEGGLLSRAELLPMKDRFRGKLAAVWFENLLEKAPVRYSNEPPF
ncbi:hypothetical protein [Streptomyces sp. NPDC014995]|uniref:hypothetical protein n=1 Tax=Streptomyces sp. NPDC014995 TaxID=3364936 RepID=UPI0037035010